VTFEKHIQINRRAPGCKHHAGHFSSRLRVPLHRDHSIQLIVIMVSYRSRIIGIFMTAIPISIILGSVVSSQLLLLDGWLGLQGWQWLFILEAVPPIVLGVVVMIYLTDVPALAKWLRPDQQQC
jgi:MFS family permease